uniref:Uncharacterized protein n=1 Tax=Lygus hesperus TaxID=30085 RepID=A0A0K8TBF2_LYGHE
MFYCDEREQDKCPEEFTVSGGRKWEEAPPDDDPTEFEDDKWELKIKGMTIICVTSDVKYCKKVHKGKWKPSNRGIDDDGVPENSRWEISTGDAKVYCDAKSAKHCPKLKKGKWGPAEEPDEPGDEPEDELGMNKWELTLSGKTIICVAHSVNECKKIHKGHWKHCTKDHCNEDSKWWIPKDKTRVYCNEESHKSCPKVHGGHGWEKNPGNPDDPAPMWQLHIKGKELICVAFHVSDCKKVHKGHWKPCYGDRTPSGLPDNSRWMIIIGKARVYCESKSPNSCPELSKGGGRWQEVPGGSDDGEPDQMWELSVGGETLVCVARNAKDCNKIRNGHWKPAKHTKKDANGHPEGSNWWIIVGRTRGYCKSKSSKSCPAPDKGGKWKKVPGGRVSQDDNKKTVPNDRRDVDAGEIAPSVVGGGRFKQSQDDDTVYLCYAVDTKGCPEGSKWIQTKNEVGEKVRYIITRKSVWVLEISGTYVVCIADELSSCKPKNNDGWVIIAGMKAGLWKLTYKGVVVYCEAAEKTNCPEEFGDWELVSMDQWVQKILDLNKKGDMWRMVTFRFTAYCGAKYKGKCPKLKDYLWHKVFGDHIDFSAYGKVIRFKKLIKNALYYCKAKSEDACPELPYNESWEKITEPVTLDEVLAYFEDIVGFEDNCRSGICKVPKNVKNDPFE